MVCIREDCAVILIQDILKLLYELEVREEVLLVIDVLSPMFDSPIFMNDMVRDLKSNLLALLS